MEKKKEHKTHKVVIYSLFLEFNVCLDKQSNYGLNVSDIKIERISNLARVVYNNIDEVNDKLKFAIECLNCDKGIIMTGITFDEIVECDFICIPPSEIFNRYYEKWVIAPIKSALEFLDKINDN